MIYLLILSAVINITLAVYAIVSNKKKNGVITFWLSQSDRQYKRLAYRDSLLENCEGNLKPKYLRRKIAKFDRAA